MDLIAVDRGLNRLDVEKGGFKGSPFDYEEFRGYEEAWVTHFQVTRDAVDPFDPAKKAARYIEQYGIAEIVGHKSPDSPAPNLNGAANQPVYRFEAALAPEEARKLAENLAFRVLANTKPWTSGEWIVCHERWKLEGMFNDDQYFDICFLTVEVETVALMDLTTGDILKSWPGRFSSNNLNQRVSH